MSKLYPLPTGVQALEYRKDGRRTQRCSKCHAERQQSELHGVKLDAADQLYPLMCGNDLVGVLCARCVPNVEGLIQKLMFPDGMAFPFVDPRGELQRNPQCDKGHGLHYTDDGRAMRCPTCEADEADAELEQQTQGVLADLKLVGESLD